MFSKKFLASMSVLCLTASPIAFTAEQINEAKVKEAYQTIEQEKKKAALTMLQQEALKSLVYASILSKEVGSVSQISDEVREKYNYARLAPFISPFMSAGGIGMSYLLQGSLDEFKSILEPITVVIRQIGILVEKSSDIAVESSEKIGLHHLFRISGESLESSADAFAAVFRSLSTNGMQYLWGMGVVGGSLYGSSYVSMNNAEEAVADSKYIRDLLGYNEELEQKINEVTGRLSSVFSMTYEKEVAFKELLKNAIIEEGIKKEFNADEMKVDVFALLSKVLEKDHMAAVQGIKAVYDSATEVSSGVSTEDATEKSVGMLLAISAVLEEIRKSKDLTKVQRAELDSRVLSIQATIKQSLRLNS